MSEYKDTLNLPKTGFPMKANLAQREPGILQRWQKEQIYREIRSARAGREKFILHDGPPYANGEIHLGHALNKILKDIIVKARTLDGFDCPYIPGWDCHGLPIEHKVETKIGKAGVKVEPSLFRQKCREYALRQVDGQRKDFIRLGVFGDWENPYLTVDYKTEADIIRALGKIIDSGHLVRGFKPVYWSVVGGSALAEAEVEYQDKVSHSIDVRFRVADEASFLDAAGGGAGEGPLSVVIWTTTPWTLPSNQAVSLHPDLEYQILQCETAAGNERLIVASELLDAVMSRFGIETYQSLASFKGASVERQPLQHPFYECQVPIILGEHVTTEAGTGAVHTAPDHGLDDFNVGQQYGLTALHRVNDQGYFSADTELFAGEHVYKVDEKVIEVLREQGNLVHADQFTHSFPHCWRTKTPLIYRATPQWFISMTGNNLMGQVKEAVANVQWTPDWGQARMEAMLNSSPDWCISRQRTWGVPIALFVHKEDQSLHPRTLEIIEQVAQRVEQKGMDAWFESSVQDWLDGADADNYIKSTDTLDVWFDSGVTHYSVLKQREELAFPADLYLEGSDQHRGWFQSSLKTSMAMNGCPPYKAVLTHGFTVDAQGRKQSKSLGNVVSPQKVTSQLGADVLRLWVAATDFSGEMTCTDDIIKQVADSYRRIRNTVRYLLSGLDGFNPDTDLVPTQDMLALDRWALGRAAALQADIIGLYQEYNFHQIYQKLHNFCSIDMGGFYLDILKDRLYTCKTDGNARRSAQTALYHLAEAMVRWITPILSFTADEIWSFMPGKREASVFLQEWYADLPALENDTMDAAFWQRVMSVKTAVNKELEAARVGRSIGGSLDAEVVLYCDESLQSLLSRLEDELRFVLITSRVTIAPWTGETGNATDVAGLRVAVSACAATKCERCWHHREDVGQDSSHPTICSRCIENIEGRGEARFYA